MSIMKYFKQNKESLPNPRGDLCSSILSRAIVLANQEVYEAQKKPFKKHGQYFRYSECSVITVVCKLPVALFTY